MKEEQRFSLKMRDFNLDQSSDKQKYNKELFTPVSLVYEKITKVLSFGRDRAWKRKLMAMIPENYKELQALRILDIACGPGDLTFLCAGRLKESRITGIDLNKAMLEKAEENLEKKPDDFRRRIDFRTGDMNSLDFADSEFSLITGGYALRNAPDLKQTLKEIFRVMKPGASALFLDFAPASRPLNRKIQTALLSFWGRIWGFIYHRNPEVYGYISESLKRFPPKNEFIQLAKETGFKSITFKRQFFGFIFLAALEK